MSDVEIDKTHIDALKELRTKLRNKGIFISNLTECVTSEVTDWVKTPALDLNRILSGSLFKGIPHRNLVGIVGPEHTMKSSFMVLCMVEAQKKGYDVLIIDSENGCNKDFCSRWGLDHDTVEYSFQQDVDNIKIILAQYKEYLLKTGRKAIIGIDSVGGLDQGKVFTDALAGDPKADQGQLQKKIRSMLKMLLNIIITTGSIGIVTGHMYSRPGLVPMPDQIGGGKAMRMFPSILLSVKNTKSEDGTTSIIATTLKNRLYPPNQEAIIKIDYTKGIDKYAGIIDLAIKAGLVEKAGSWYNIKDGERLGQGLEKASKELEKYPELLDKLNIWLEDTKYSSINEKVKEAEELLSKMDLNTEEDLENALQEKEKKKGSKKV